MSDTVFFVLHQDVRGTAARRLDGGCDLNTLGATSDRQEAERRLSSDASYLLTEHTAADLETRIFKALRSDEDGGRNGYLSPSSIWWVDVSFRRQVAVA
ncbi:hypothetical protein [Sphingomonas baiyangensis]|uniref:Uncharacterized protein n=1 Tax=Sphingomonas baiyangensis TaxID=2572576 RepID=A0A4U1L2W0_9SPHN|nr:hypothetical protein [Sphingomonas baiyangensis]TKD50560.1 hypothetical protein FBR43_07125 [Sphingomonas baiyangensis]